MTWSMDLRGRQYDRLPDQTKQDLQALPHVMSHGPDLSYRTLHWTLDHPTAAWLVLKHPNLTEAMREL